MRIFITDSLKKLFFIDVDINKFSIVKELLRYYDIPIELVIVRKNGEIVTENVPITEDISLDIIRHLDLPKLSTLPVLRQKTKDSIYIKAVQKFDTNKNKITIFERELNKKDFINLFENTFLDTIKKYDMIPKHQKIGVALSGGKDSVSMALIIGKYFKKLGNPDITTYTLEGWGQEQENTYRYAREIPVKFDFKHRVITTEEITKAFHLNKKYEKVFEEIVKTKKLTPNEKTLVLAQTQRRMVEITAANDGIYNLFFALNKVDLLSEVILTYTTGHLAFSLPVRPVAPFTYYYPLAFLSKKEVAIYLNLAYPQYINQEPSQLVECGSQTAQFHIKFCDNLFEIWPGIEYELFSAYKKITAYMKDKIVLSKCRNCGSTLVDESNDTSKLMCGGCKIYKKLGFIK